MLKPISPTQPFAGFGKHYPGWATHHGVFPSKAHRVRDAAGRSQNLSVSCQLPTSIVCCLRDASCSAVQQQRQGSFRGSGARTHVLGAYSPLRSGDPDSLTPGLLPLPRTFSCPRKQFESPCGFWAEFSSAGGGEGPQALNRLRGCFTVFASVQFTGNLADIDLKFKRAHTRFRV